METFNTQRWASGLGPVFDIVVAALGVPAGVDELSFMKGLSKEELRQRLFDAGLIGLQDTMEQALDDLKRGDAEQAAGAGAVDTASAVLVNVVIEEDRIHDFLVAMEDDASKSRIKDQDPGCLRFDLLQDRNTPNRFFMYEAYVDDEAAAFHKTTPHYKSWADFKASGGVKKQDVVKLATNTIVGGWAFQSKPTISGPVASAVLVTVVIKEDRISDFLSAMHDDVSKSRMSENDPGCVRFDLLRDREQVNKFVFYEAYRDDEAAAFHKTTAHYNSWAEFKRSGGVESQEVVKVAISSIADWAFDPRN